MGFKDKLSALIYGSREEEAAPEGETVTNSLGETVGYKPGNTTTSMRPMTAPQQAEQTAGTQD